MSEGICFVLDKKLEGRRYADDGTKPGAVDDEWAWRRHDVVLSICLIMSRLGLFILRSKAKYVPHICAASRGLSWGQAPQWGIQMSPRRGHGSAGFKMLVQSSRLRYHS